jgi:hypothetical protein
MPIGRKTAIENNCSLFAHFAKRLRLPYLVSVLSPPALRKTTACFEFIYATQQLLYVHQKVMNPQQAEGVRQH